MLFCSCKAHLHVQSENDKNVWYQCIDKHDPWDEVLLGDRILENQRCVSVFPICACLQFTWLTLGQCVSQCVVWEGTLGASDSPGPAAGGHGGAAGAPPGWLMQAHLKSSQGECAPFISCCALHTPGPTSHCHPSTLLTAEMLHCSVLMVWNWGGQTENCLSILYFCVEPVASVSFVNML